MTARAASSTAVLVCQGRAAADGRLGHGRFSDPVARDLLDPREQAVVDRVRSGATPPAGRDRMVHEIVRRTGILMTPRTVAIDDAVRRQGGAQVVVLGAGLDARAWRMGELAATTVFEVDHPASQADKLRRVAGRMPVARRVVPAAVDLADDPLAPALEAAGFDASTATTWVWEGVVPYLTPDAVHATVGQLAALSAPGSLLVVSYQARSLTAGVMRRVVRAVSRLSGQDDPMAGEPWRSTWSPTSLREMLADNGFRLTSDDDLMTLAEGMDLPHDADASLRNGRVAVAVRA